MNRVLFVFTPLIVGFCSLSIHPSDTKERITEMSILLVPVGEIDEKVMGRLQVDLGKIFNEQIEVGQEMPHPGHALNKKRNQYFSRTILKALMEGKCYMAYGKILRVVDQDLIYLREKINMR